MIRTLICIAVVGLSTAQYVQRPQASSPDAIDTIPAWYQMSKSAAQQQAAAAASQQAYPQAVNGIAPSYYERRDHGNGNNNNNNLYERQPSMQQFAGYPSYQNRPPYESLNALAQAGSMNLAQGGARRYGGQDGAVEPAVVRYHKLLLKRLQGSTTPKVRRITPKRVMATTTTTPPKTVVGRVTPRAIPKSLRKIYSTIAPRKKMWKKVTPRRLVAVKATTTTTTTEVVPTTTEEETTQATQTTTEPSEVTKEASEVLSSTAEPTVSTTDDEELLIKETEPEGSATTPEDLVTDTTVPSTTVEEVESTSGVPTASPVQVAPHRYICNKHKHTVGGDHQLPSRPTVGPFRPSMRIYKPIKFVKRVDNDKDNKTVSVDGDARSSKFIDYLMPNTELLAAIKDVVAKFKASLDEAGIDQDVRLMGNQLKNTWQQLRTGLDRSMKTVRQSAENSLGHFEYNQKPFTFDGPMNEQLGRLFEKAAADAADQKQTKLQYQRPQ